LPDELVDVLLAVARVAALNEVKALLGEAALRRGELEGPEEFVHLLEAIADSVDLVDHVLNREHVELAESVLDELVVRQGSALTIDLTETALVDELADRLEVGVTKGNVGRDEVEHLEHGLREAHKDTVVDLAQTQELEDLADLGRHTVDTEITYNKHK